MSVYATSIATEVDFERDGKQVGRLHLPHSVTRSAYGVIPIPVAVIANGKGPTVALMAGNHGDEYEGQVALGNLIRDLEPADVAGRVVILPSANLPAARAGQRTSPLDGANLNRIFPANAALGPTHEIAAWIESRLMAMADIFVDLHSGGSSLAYLPFVAAGMTGDPARDRRAWDLMRAFGGAHGQLWGSDAGASSAGGAAARRGCVTIGGEFGGFGTVDPGHLRLVERGLRNLLAAAGVLPGAGIEETGPMRLMSSDSSDLYVFATDRGVFVPEVSLGDEVEAGARAGAIHDLDHPERPPIPVAFRAAGLVICLRTVARVEPGDCLAHQAVDIEAPAFARPACP